MKTRLATLLTGLLGLSLAVLLPACKQDAPPAATTPDKPPTQAAAPAEPSSDTGGATMGATCTMGVVLGQGAVAKTVEAGMRQVAPANGADLKVGADAKALMDQKVSAIVLVGVSGDAAKAAGDGKVPVIVLGGEANGKVAAHLAGGTALDTLSEAQAKELGRVAVETTWSLLNGDKGVDTKRSMQSIL